MQIVLYILIGLFIALLAVIFVPPIRYLAIKLLMSSFIKNPVRIMGATERDAIGCGDVAWEKELFFDGLDWDLLKNIKSSELSDEEVFFIDNKVPSICATFKEHGLSDQTITQIKEDGFWSINMPKKYNGLGFSAKAHAKILTQLSSCDISLAVTVMVPNSLGPAELILHYGTEEQKTNLLPKLATGEHIPCFALTSKQAGSDASAMIDTGEVCYGEYKGEKTLGLLLNWNKRYTTLAPMATLIGLAFKTFDPNGLLGDKKELGISCALVDASLEGVHIGRHHHPMGSAFSNGPHSGNDVFIPMESVIGGKDMIGSGWVMLMECLSLGRGVSLPSLSMAGVNLSLKSSIEYSLIRHQFNRPIYDFQGVAEKIVLMASDLLEMKALSDMHLGLLDSKTNPSISSAILKYNHTELLRINVNRAMDIHGGKTVMLGDKNYLSDIYQTIPIAITVEGANILTRSMIIFGQGLVRCHPFLMGEIEALEKADAKSLSALLGQHIYHFYRLKVNSFSQSFTGGYFVKCPEGTAKDMRVFYKQLSMISAGFAFLVEMALFKHGSKFKFQESFNGMFSDLLIKMYGISALLRYSDGISADFNDLTQYTLRLRLSEAQLLLSNICDQFWFKRMIKLAVIPRGLTIGRPLIAAQDKIMSQLITNQDFKESLIDDVVCLENTTLGTLDEAFKLARELKDLCKKVGYQCTQEKIDSLLEQQQISAEEHRLLFKLSTLIDQALEVNDYED